MTETSSARISVFINGRARQFPATRTLGDVAQEFGLDPKQLLVEQNGQALLREEWPGRTLEHGDRVEFIRVVAGG